jgi:tRNA-dihydrouridine synthase 2
MVRASTLPFREECLTYGADLVFTEEVVDKKILDSIVSELEDGTLLFKTSRCDTRTVHLRPDRKNQTVLQLGTADDILAVNAANKLVNYVSEININMGCPKPFSIQGGMGAALLSNPEKATKIVRALRTELPTDTPVTCKIRYLGEGSDSSHVSIKRTSEFIKALSDAGADAIIIHMRTKPMRPREPAVWDKFTDLVETLTVDVPIVANGDFFDRTRIEEFKSRVTQQLRGREWCNSVMIARGALWNPSIFSDSPYKPEQVIQNFFKTCRQYNEPSVAVKWTVSQMMDNTKTLFGYPTKIFRERVQVAKTMEDIESIVFESKDDS